MSSPDTIVISTKSDFDEVNTDIGDAAAGLVKRVNDLELSGGNKPYEKLTSSLDLNSLQEDGGYFATAVTNGPPMTAFENTHYPNFMIEVSSTASSGARIMKKKLYWISVNGFQVIWQRTYSVAADDTVTADDDWEEIIQSQYSGLPRGKEYELDKMESGGIITFTTSDNLERTGWLLRNFSSAITANSVPALSIRVRYRYNSDNQRQYKLELVTVADWLVASASLSIGEATSTGSGSHTEFCDESSSIVRNNNEMVLFDWMDSRRAVHGTIMVVNNIISVPTSVTLELTTYIIDTNRVALHVREVSADQAELSYLP
ncbi:hypothetical protein [Vibrio phage vB_VmeM-Yong XC32]|nr:hypothetical protein [Vibrio phage vB_VmeM-Yong XC31]QAX96568.1 hypothetical protein [Vibrio phage vB_VmeM-Yong XC32]QAX96886.1 hypothetical protein [Vibrio phage vB_VmeM-Yong MS31]QAX97191.1 hypothetical protein [Vibrio phage vB_VmeM-Yong MS32]